LCYLPALLVVCHTTNFLVNSLLFFVSFIALLRIVC
jgi:hypothetical protein